MLAGEGRNAREKTPIAVPLCISQVPRGPAMGSSPGFRGERIVDSSLIEVKTASFHIHSDYYYYYYYYIY
jgi:hypothetical protein